MKTIFLLRHGQVEPEYQGVCRGTLDCRLSELGKEQSEANSKFLHRQGVEIIFTSGLQRSDYVGMHANAMYGIEHKVEGQLHERYLGNWQGQMWSDIQGNMPHQYDNFKKDPVGCTLPSGELPNAFLKRSELFWNSIIESQHMTIAIIGHGIINTAFLFNICLLSPKNFYQNTGCIHTIEYDDNKYLLRNCNQQIISN